MRESLPFDTPATRRHRRALCRPRSAPPPRCRPALDTPSTRAIAAIGKQAWFALMNRKSRTAACRSPEQTRPRLLREYRAPAAAACSHAAAGSTHHARMRSDQEPPPPGGPRVGQPGRPTREWSGRLAQTRGLDRQDYVQHGRGRPSVGETPANMVDVFLASAAPLARDSGCPPNRVNPSRDRSLILGPNCAPNPRNLTKTAG